MFTEDQMVAWENRTVVQKTWAALQKYFTKKWLKHKQLSSTAAKQSWFKEAVLLAQETAAAKEEGELQAKLFVTHGKECSTFKGPSLRIPTWFRVLEDSKKINLALEWLKSDACSAESEEIRGNLRISKNEASQEPKKKRNAQPRSAGLGILNFAATVPMGTTYRVTPQQMSARRIPMTWFCEMANIILGDNVELLEYRHLIANQATRATWKLS